MFYTSWQISFRLITLAVMGIRNKKTTNLVRDWGAHADRRIQKCKGIKKLSSPKERVIDLAQGGLFTNPLPGVLDDLDLLIDNADGVVLIKQKQ